MLSIVLRYYTYCNIYASFYSLGLDTYLNYVDLRVLLYLGALCGHLVYLS